MFWLFYPFYNWGFVPFFFLTVDLSVLMSPKLGGSWPVADVCFYRPVSGAEATLRTEDSQLPHRLCPGGRLVLCRREMPKNESPRCNNYLNIDILIWTSHWQNPISSYWKLKENWAEIICETTLGNYSFQFLAAKAAQ